MVDISEKPGSKSDVPSPLTESAAVGESSSKLLAPYQVGAIKEMVNAKLLANPKEPLGVLYDLLHSFCLNLQFSVLTSQIEMLKV